MNELTIQIQTDKKTTLSAIYGSFIINMPYDEYKNSLCNNLHSFAKFTFKNYIHNISPQFGEKYITDIIMENIEMLISKHKNGKDQVKLDFTKMGLNITFVNYPYVINYVC